MRRVAICGGFLAAIAAVIALKSRAGSVEAAPAPDVIDELTTTCTGGADSASCPMLQAAVVADVYAQLVKLQQSHSPDALDVAIEAAGVDEPQLQQFAAKMLVGSSRADVGPAVVPLLLGDHPAVQRVAAEVLASAGTDALQLVAERWKAGHPISASTVVQSAYEVATPPPIVTKYTMYPRAQRYSPGDSSQSIGWRTTDALAKVVAFYAPGGKKVDAATWRPLAASTASVDADMAEIKRLADLYAKTQDPKLVAKMQALQAKIQAGAQAQTAATNTTVYARPVPSGDAGATFICYVVEGTTDKPARAIAIYREAAIKSTVIEMVWDTSRYPAW